MIEKDKSASDTSWQLTDRYDGALEYVVYESRFEFNSMLNWKPLCVVFSVIILYPLCYIRCCLLLVVLPTVYVHNMFTCWVIS